MWFECCNLCSAFIEQTFNNFGYVHHPPKITDTGRDKSIRGDENVYYVLIATQGKKNRSKIEIRARSCILLVSFSHFATYQW